VRTRENLPIPVGNRSPGPSGKRANAGPERINNPGDLGGPGFKPPKETGPLGKVIIGAAAATATHDAICDVAGRSPEELISEGYRKPLPPTLATNNSTPQIGPDSISTGKPKQRNTTPSYSYQPVGPGQIPTGLPMRKEQSNQNRPVGPGAIPTGL
jgi:hypothetical protein